MPRHRRSKPVATQALELAWAVPQVVAHRVTRLATSGPQPSARDRQEFQRMGSEKLAAFSEAAQAVVQQAWLAQARFAMTALQPWWAPWAPQAHQASLAAPARYLQDLAALPGQGLAPVHRRATANARRLARTRLK